MDKVVQDSRDNLRDILIQRDQDRKEKIKNLKEEKQLSEPNQTQIFNDSFENQHQNILEKIKLVEEGKIKQECLLNYFNDINKDIQALNRHLSTSTKFLNNFSVRRGLKTVEEVENKIKNLEAELFPRKKFGFKAQKAKTVNTSNKDKVKESIDVVDAVVKKVISFSTVSCGFSNEIDKTLKLDSEEITKKDIELTGLENCTVLLFGNPITVHISNVSRCKILCGPVSTSVFVENCKDSDLVVACQQLRIHSTLDSNFYIHVTSKAIIEDSSGVQFAPYNLDYIGIKEHFSISGLDWRVNKWCEIDDFNWLTFNVPSPNWKEIPEESRIQKWL
ncbi:tubulin-specific chaperone C [Homalodisca vitripennis]|uniref:tubulin-specific chaperone C n=1 Tax=Homalodisca vitripennis TaxID=197043 RepID=UPI001EEB6955|nr:tubulin-specific chaperone C [Homalodisca vitripennis]